MSGLILLLSNWQSHVFLLNSRLGHFSAPTSLWGPFSLSYRTNLPSSLATDHSSTFGFSPRPPVSVYGTGGYNISLETFLGSLLNCMSTLLTDRRTFQLQLNTGFASYSLPSLFNVLFRQHAAGTLLRHSFSVIVSIGILTDCPLSPPLGYDLGPD